MSIRMRRFVTLQDVLSAAECSKIIAAASGAQTESGRVSDGGDAYGERTDHRVCDVVPRVDVSVLRPAEVRLQKLLLATNAKYWRFDISATQALQVVRYPVGGRYNWHVDLSEAIPYHTRKLSLTVQLSRSDSYEGGGLELYFGAAPLTASRQQGTATLFPSYALHRVAPVTAGERWALVTWAVGDNPYR